MLVLLDPLTDRPTGQRLSSVPLGSVVVLTLQLTSPDDLGPVTLAVMMPGGLEPLDPNTAAGAGGEDGGLGLSCGANWVMTDSAWGGSSFFRGWWWPMCPSQETRPQLVTFSYLALRSGTSSVSVRAVAATPGTFIFPPVRAFADNQPELSGIAGRGEENQCGCGSSGLLEPVIVDNVLGMDRLVLFLTRPLGAIACGFEPRKDQALMFHCSSFVKCQCKRHRASVALVTEVCDPWWI
ncbi:hypothetical protein VOLCADRAFT_100323 [Volvox carteri f. nagariensis]|uniref:Bacterial alpha-2-macroglobulin MG10 domain-containing protein n=1 Tax=Volvox carteri f. nagariensis TaxID=3068 RepID=D8UK01_VOLCA|nr:uncharacterized protein VOLCADRAFT_100323 [Volvox carteri f. nagariensis]EFJ39954.1 hypothetical protein VOLCADRAFT_100323 [Volvox carteri f. nagariensis]|eukprot:XP_002958979.1 hypothetical protein VOLCADRAFT_100323 [Volvox carteri f. nagariensis]